MHPSRILFCLSMFSLTCNGASTVLHAIEVTSSRLTRVATLRSYPLYSNVLSAHLATKSAQTVSAEPWKWNRRTWNRDILNFESNCLATQVKDFDPMLHAIGQELSRKLKEVSTLIHMGADPSEFRRTAIDEEFVESKIRWRNRIKDLESRGVDLSPIAGPRDKIEQLIKKYYDMMEK